MAKTYANVSAFVDGTLAHCGEAVRWDDCDTHETDCYLAICNVCYEQWKDCEDGLNV